MSVPADLLTGAPLDEQLQPFARKSEPEPEPVAWPAHPVLVAYCVRCLGQAQGGQEPLASGAGSTGANSAAALGAPSGCPLASTR
ncbi:hypothetical protein [Kitasatospora sp. NPDC057223]|uniref:hypothetical protein n=1 Tax=Kitasatospora sp. NPDC057223 TaxID=3346055 RepID=UPI00363A7F71